MPDSGFTDLLIVAATAIGLEIGAISASAAAALLAAGLLSVLTFPLLGLTILRQASEPCSETETSTPLSSPTA